MSGNQLKTHPSLLEEINMLVKGNEDLSALVSDVLRRRHILPNSSRPTERPRVILKACSPESCKDVPPDVLLMIPPIEAVTARLSKVVLSDVEGSPLSNSFVRNAVYEDSADDEASSDDSRDSLSSWLTMDSSDEDSKYPSTLDDDYDDSSSDESSESGPVEEESLRPGEGKDLNGNSVKTVDERDGESGHCKPSTVSSGEIEALKGENKRPSSDDSSGSKDSSTTGELCDEISKVSSIFAESNSEIKTIEGKNKKACSDDSRGSEDKSLDSSKVDDSCDEESEVCRSAVSNSEREGDKKRASSDGSSGSDDTSLDSSKTDDSCDEESKVCSSAESDSDIEGKNQSASSDDTSLDSSKTDDSCDELKHFSSLTESYSETEDENKSTKSDDSSGSDEKSSDSSQTVDSCDELNHFSSSTESFSETEDESKSDSSDDSSESDGNSSNDSTRDKDSVEEAHGERITRGKDSSEESDDESSELSTSESEPSSNKIESNSRSSSFHDGSFVKTDSTDASTSPSSDFSEDEKSDENSQFIYPKSGDKVWIEPRRRLSSDWGESSLIKSDDSLVCMKAGKDKLIITKKNKIGEIQSIYFVPDFLKWTGSSPSENESTETMSSSDESEPTVVKSKKVQHKRYEQLHQLDQLNERASTSSEVNLLERALTGVVLDSTFTSPLDESKDNADMSPSYRKYSSISEDSSPCDKISNGQSGPQSQESNTYLKFKDVDE